ncbi:MAG: para-aminobenzoate synthase component [Alphaproteobacteria bacterium]|nr:para-aminobenzoate synthase component [Alphaproteobacteria bacterium]
MFDGSSPFVLLDDAREAGASPALLYRKPVGTIETRDPDQVKASLARLREALAAGLHVAGFLSYEAGYCLEDRLARWRAAPPADAPPLLWFGLFEKVVEIAPEHMAAHLPEGRTAWASPPVPRIGASAYLDAVARVKRHIADGDVYQANLTFPADVHFSGEPLALYAALRDRARAGHGGIVFTGNHWLLSFSPELFFALSDGRLTARPMKGTAPRVADPGEDRAAAASLAEDPKQRAENLMIVDLLRNDAARVSRPGTVKVPELFTVEHYPTVHQMISQVTAELAPGTDAVDVLEAIFPCGSVTGAPKIRAMELITELEPQPRGVYTGAIGRIAPAGEARFNVAIRTLAFRAGETCASLGLGSGVVADSRGDEEWRECLAKGGFGSDGTSSFDLIETMAFDPHEGIARLEQHLLRMKASAAALGFAFDRHHARNELQAATFRFRDAKKLRLMLARSGAIAIESRTLPAAPARPIEVALLPLPVAASDFRLRHKTSDRAFYDAARAQSGCFEAVFVDADGFLTEGSFTSLFVERAGALLTPPLSRPILPGILRAELIAEGEAEEAELKPADLGGVFYIGNAVRGLVRARLAG